MSQIRTVVELDMVGYSDIARKAEKDYGHPIAVAELNKEIQEIVDSALKKLDLAPKDVVKARNGDNAVIVFDDPIKAHLFAEAVHLHAKEHNDRQQKVLAQRWFRIGCATGLLHEDVNNETKEISGVVIADAYRLEAAASPGEFLIDEATYNALKDFLKTDNDPYLDPETAHGKRVEKFPNARRWQVIPRISLLELMEQNPQFKKAVNIYLANLGEIKKIIDKLDNYKSLHEYFQQLENPFRIFKNIKDSLNSYNFEDKLYEIKQYDQEESDNRKESAFRKDISKIQEILQEKENVLDVGKEIVQKWNRKLALIKNDFKQCSKSKNNDELKSSLFSIGINFEDLLYTNGITLLNRKLVNSAEKLTETQLQVLINNLNEIYGLYSNSTIIVIPNTSQVKEIKQNIQDMNEINEKLKKMLKLHDSLQNFDNEFLNIQSKLKKRFSSDGLDENTKILEKRQILKRWDELYPDLIYLFSSIDMPEHSEVKKSIINQVNSINTELIQGDDIDKKLEIFASIFTGLRVNIDNYFRNVDQELLKVIKTELITTFESLQKHDVIFDISQISSDN